MRPQRDHRRPKLKKKKSSRKELSIVKKRIFLRSQEQGSPTGGPIGSPVERALAEKAKGGGSTIAS